MSPKDAKNLNEMNLNAVKLDAVFHALADSTRRTILQELAKRNEQSLYEICVRLMEEHGLSLARQSISKHLAVLEEAELIVTSWSGRTKLHTTQFSSVLPLITRWIETYKLDSQ